MKILGHAVMQWRSSAAELLTVEAEQVLLFLRGAVHLHDGDGEAVGGGGEHRRGQGHVVLIKEL